MSAAMNNMASNTWLRLGLAAVAVAGVVGLLTFERPPVESVQRGFRGVAMGQVYNPRTLEAQAPLNVVPEAQPATEKADQPSSAVYQNVQVLKDLDANEFLRLMTAITEWVSPQQGCTYCHAEGQELSSDSLYTKVVARRMLQMTMAINTDWKNHVSNTGVTCFTCHRGQPVPANIWFDGAPRAHFNGFVGDRAGQNAPSRTVAYASLPNEVLTAFLEYDREIRVAGRTALPDGNRQSIKQTEATYGLMMHFSQSLGVNCTFCHNSRAFASWDESTPQRGSAWYGIRMVRDLNATFLESLKNVFPHARLGPTGDVAKVNCATCHQGAFKPLYGANMTKDYPELVMTLPPEARAETPAPAKP